MSYLIDALALAILGSLTVATVGLVGVMVMMAWKEFRS